MKIVFITPGTGSYYCGVCVRDNALVAAFREQGCETTMLPMYLPAVLDEPSVCENVPIFFGGINVFLQQKMSLFRHTPEWLDRLLDNRALLSIAGKMSGMTDGREHGALTVSVLEGERGNQVKEVRKLVNYLREKEKPDIVFLSTAMLAGLASPIKKALGIPVHCFFQGEDSFLDNLESPYDERAWGELGQALFSVDEIIAPSQYYAGYMASRLQLEENRVRVIPNGINIDGLSPAKAEPEQPTIGFLARMNYHKGLGDLVDAFIGLQQRGKVGDCRLHIAGAAAPVDDKFIQEQRKKLQDAGLLEVVRFSPNMDRAEKITFLQGLSLLTVPSRYAEAFGLYLIEALATGVPVVQPRRAAYPEIVEATGGGILYEPDSIDNLIEAWEDALIDIETTRQMGKEGRIAVEKSYTIDNMVRSLLAMDCNGAPDKSVAQIR